MADPTRVQVLAALTERLCDVMQPVAISDTADVVMELFYPLRTVPSLQSVREELTEAFYLVALETPQRWGRGIITREWAALCVDLLDERAPALLDRLAEAPQPRVLWEGTPAHLEVNLRILHSDGAETNVHTSVESGSHLRVVIEDTGTPDA